MVLELPASKYPELALVFLTENLCFSYWSGKLGILMLQSMLSQVLMKVLLLAVCLQIDAIILEKVGLIK